MPVASGFRSVGALPLAFSDNSLNEIVVSFTMEAVALQSVPDLVADRDQPCAVGLSGGGGLERQNGEVGKGPVGGVGEADGLLHRRFLQVGSR
ncbi:hypothetical protein CCP2SC5_1010007 [Azospirillaceae bacterium]